MVDTRESTSPSAAAPVRARTRRLPWWVCGITFVVGLVAGVLTVGLLSLGTPDFAAGVAAEAPTGPAATPGGAVPVVAQAQVNAACLAVINGAQDVYIILTDVDDAVTDVDLQQLDDIVRRLQPVEARLGRDLQRCEVTTDVAADPSPQPSATSTG